MQPEQEPGVGVLSVGTMHMLRERLSSLQSPLTGTRAPSHLEQYFLPPIVTLQTPVAPPQSLSWVHSEKVPYREER